MINITEREQWFIDRIGKSVWLSRPICSCEKCKKAFNEGLLIHDNRYAIDLAETEERHTAEGYPIRFCDTKAEAIKFDEENPSKKP